LNELNDLNDLNAQLTERNAIQKNKFELEIIDLRDENDNLKEEVEKLRTENSSLKLMKSKVEIERNRLEVSLQKTALGIDIVDFDNKKLIQENRALSQLIIEKKIEPNGASGTSGSFVSNGAQSNLAIKYVDGKPVQEQCSIFW